MINRPVGPVAQDVPLRSPSRRAATAYGDVNVGTIRQDYDTICGNPALNETTLSCAEALPDAEARKILDTIKGHRDRGNIALADHTSREIVTGRHLVRNGHEVEYERDIQGKTPDWATVANGQVTAIAECVKHNQSKGTAASQDDALSAGEVWTGYIDDSVARLLKKMTRKAFKYADLARDLNVPYVVAVFENFYAPAWDDEVDAAASQVFTNFQDLSGILYVKDGNGLYHFRYIPNPGAARPLQLSSGSWNLHASRVAAAATVGGTP